MQSRSAVNADWLCVSSATILQPVTSALLLYARPVCQGVLAVLMGGIAADRGEWAR